MKKIVFSMIFGVLLISTCLFSGCNITLEVKGSNEDFMVVSDTVITPSTRVEILVHKETKVMYMLYLDNYGKDGGGLTVMLDADGKPLIYQGDLD